MWLNDKGVIKYMKEKIAAVLRFVIRILRAALCAVGGCFHKHHRKDDISSEEDAGNTENSNK